ncbi:hypothetical protein O3G_MSEX008699 [Manduca sexta]|uniref:FP protein C-terminal domain-containing protein n=1 Tax=Manduca sexta TaxID=7130 RepID=A0A921ZBM4_MANSE|nr:hypothetical protein O3G_MSEX008699 [Manduca sexta]
MSTKRNSPAVTSRTKPQHRKAAKHECDIESSEVTNESLRAMIREEVGRAIQDAVREIMDEKFVKVTELLNNFTVLTMSTKRNSPAVVTSRTKPQHRKAAKHECDIESSEVTNESLRAMIREEVGRAIQDAVREIMDEKFVKVTELLNNFQQSLSFFNETYEEMKRSLEEKNAKIHDLENKNTALQVSVKDITKRINQLEQHARASNVELQCVPEHRAENLVNTVKQLATVIKCNINDSEILHCTRIAKINPTNKRPRSIIVKFSSPRIRNSFLAAAITYNKTNKKDKLSSAHLGISTDNPAPIYVVEHLSPENKSIHAAARLRSKELGYKYLWVRNGKIFMKKEESSETLLINNFEKLRNLT